MAIKNLAAHKRERMEKKRQEQRIRQLAEAKPSWRKPRMKRRITSSVVATAEASDLLGR